MSLLRTYYYCQNRPSEGCIFNWQPPLRVLYRPGNESQCFASLCSLNCSVKVRPALLFDTQNNQTFFCFFCFESRGTGSHNIPMHLVKTSIQSDVQTGEELFFLVFSPTLGRGQRVLMPVAIWLNPECQHSWCGCAAQGQGSIGAFTSPFNAGLVRGSSLLTRTRRNRGWWGIWWYCRSWNLDALISCGCRVRLTLGATWPRHGHSGSRYLNCVVFLSGTLFTEIDPSVCLPNSIYSVFMIFKRNPFLVLSPSIVFESPCQMCARWGGALGRKPSPGLEMPCRWACSFPSPEKVGCTLTVLLKCCWLQCWGVQDERMKINTVSLWQTMEYTQAELDFQIMLYTQAACSLTPH